VDIPPLFNNLIMRLLSKERDERPASAKDVLSLLNDEALLDTESAPAEQLSLLDRIVRGRIIGRKAEFEEARALWRKAVSGQGQLLLISGEPGVGKTRLMREIATHAEVSGGRALIGESFAEGNPPYGAFGQIVRKAINPGSANGFEISDFVLADLLTIAPELRQHYPDIPPNPSLEPDAERQRLFENVAAFTGTLAEQSPLLLVIDDAHWSDSGSLFLLRHLARRTKNLPIMLVATYREVELIGTHPLNEMLLELNRQRLGTRVKLSRLDVEKTHRLLEAILAEDVSKEFTEVIYRETEGNPFFVEEVCKALVENGVLYFQEGKWRGPDLDEIEIPQSVQVAVEARLAKLDESILDVLRMAATLGREFEFNTLTKASDQTEDDLINALESAEDAQLLDEVSGKAGGVFSFAHALIPAALISGLSGLRRRRLHHQALAAEEELHTDDFATLAHHASEAGDVEKTLEYGEKAGDAAAALYAWEEAQSQYRRAIEAAEELNQPEKLSQLHELSGLAYASQGLNTLAIESIQKAMDLASGKARKAEMKSYIGNGYIYIGDERGLALLEEARQELNPKTQALPLANSLIGIGRHHHLHGHHQKALEAYQEAQKMADKLEDHRLQGTIYVMKAGAYQHLANFEESNKWAQASIDLGVKKNFPVAEAIGLEFMGENANATGRWQDSLDIGEREMQIARQIGDQNRIGWTHMYTGWGFHGLGMLSNAEESTRNGIEIANLSGDMRVEVFLRGQLVQILADFGRTEEAREYGLQAVERGEQLGQISMTGFSKASLAYYHIRNGEWQESLELLDAVSKSQEGLDARWLPLTSQTLQAETLWCIGELDKAAQLAEESYQSALESGAIHVQADTQRVLAQVLFSQEKYDNALEKVNATIEAAEKENYRIGLGRAMLWKAKILAAQGEKKAAKKSVSQAEELFEFCGAQPDLERVQSFAKTLA
jgi:tetratricopeptide (TPR) repeat protein